MNKSSLGFALTGLPVPDGKGRLKEVVLPVMRTHEDRNVGLIAHCVSNSLPFLKTFILLVTSLPLLLY